MNPAILEKVYVEQTYSHISDEFDKTRVSHWKGVKEFITSLQKDSLVLDAGCGNGKNMQIRSDLKYLGCDLCENFAEICKRKGFDVIVSNIKSMPFDVNKFDAVMCIAVLHHISSDEDRLLSLNELIRVLKPKGKLLFQVWAREQELTKKFIQINDNNDFFVTWTMKDSKDGELSKRYYHLFSEKDIDSLVLQLKNVKVINKTFEANNWCFVLEKL